MWQVEGMLPMRSYRPTRHQAEYIDAIAEAAAVEPWTPDGLSFEVVLPLKGPSNTQLRRNSTPATTWLGMDEEERAAIRQRLRSVQPMASARAPRTPSRCAGAGQHKKGDVEEVKIRQIDISDGSGNCKCCGRKAHEPKGLPRGFSAPQVCRRRECQRRYLAKYGGGL
jgi:hypothetical protein